MPGGGGIVTEAEVTVAVSTIVVVGETVSSVIVVVSDIVLVVVYVSVSCSPVTVLVEISIAVVVVVNGGSVIEVSEIDVVVFVLTTFTVHSVETIVAFVP